MTTTTLRQVFLAGAAIDLVIIEKSDAPTLAAGVNDPDVTQFLGRGDTPFTVEAEEEWVDNLYKNSNDLVLGIWYRKDEKLIGTCGLHKISMLNRHAIFGISVFVKEYWGRGIGTEALTLLRDFARDRKGLRMIMLEVFANNPRAIRCYEKCRFRIVGTIPKKMWWRGELIDSHWMVCEFD